LSKTKDNLIGIGNVVVFNWKPQKRSLKTQAPFFMNNEISVLSDNKFLCSHAFGGVDFDEIIES